MTVHAAPNLADAVTLWQDSDQRVLDRIREQLPLTDFTYLAASRMRKAVQVEARLRVYAVVLKAAARGDDAGEVLTARVAELLQGYGSTGNDAFGRAVAEAKRDAGQYLLNVLRPYIDADALLRALA
jgi:hypothetical protein